MDWKAKFFSSIAVRGAKSLYIYSTKRMPGIFYISTGSICLMSFNPRDSAYKLCFVSICCYDFNFKIKNKSKDIYNKLKPTSFYFI